MKVHPIGALASWSTLKPGAIFYWMNDVQYLSTKIELKHANGDPYYRAVILSANWDPSSEVCCVSEASLRDPTLALPEAVFIPIDPRPSHTLPTAGDLVQTSDGLILTVAGADRKHLVSFNVETGIGQTSSRPQGGEFIAFSGWQIALPSALHPGRFDSIFEWPKPTPP